MRYKESCAVIFQRARLRGVNIILPVDLVVGDEKVTAYAVDKSYERFDPEARDEGFDYEGETKLTSLVSEEAIVVSGYAYDVGPASISAMEKEIEKSNLLLVWGPCGLCEASAFQEGTKKFIGLTAKRPWSAEPTTECIKSRHVLLVGDSTCEWFLRCDCMK